MRNGLRLSGTAPGEPAFSRRDYICVPLIAAGMLFYGYYGLFKILNSGFVTAGGDFIRGVAAARNFMDGRSIYLMPQGANPYFYFPLVTVFFLPFSLVSTGAAKFIWFALCHVLVIFSFAAAYLYGSGRNRLVSAAAASAAILFCTPIYQTVFTGNINILVFFGLLLVYSLLLSGRARAVPILLAVFSVIKIFPAGLMAVFIRRGSIAAWRRFGLTLLAALAASLLIFGKSSLFEFARQLPHLDRFVGVFHCMSLSYFVKLFFSSAGGAVLLAGAVGLFLVLAALWRQRSSGDMEAQRASDIAGLFAFTVILTVVAPSSWVMYSAFYAAPFYFIIYGLIEGEHKFKYSWMFTGLFLFFNFWEIIYYHLPLSLDYLTINEVNMTRAAHPALYQAVFSAHFILGLGLFAWLYANYGEIIELLKDFTYE
jgi:hypothetical protein